MSRPRPGPTCALFVLSPYTGTYGCAVGDGRPLQCKILHVTRQAQRSLPALAAGTDQSVAGDHI